MTTDKFGQPYGSSWEGMSMGEGRKLHGGPDAGGTYFTEPCPGAPGKPASPDGYHHYTAVTNVQSVEHFVCDHCVKEFSD